MPRLNNIVKFGLESRARELYNQSLSLSEIADILTAESKHEISKLTVFRYLGSDAKYKAAIVEKKAELQLAVTEAEISTIADRQAIITGLKNLAENAESEHVRAQAYKIATEALDSLDKRIGKLSNSSGVTINNINAVKLSDIPTEQLLRMVNVSDR